MSYYLLVLVLLMLPVAAACHMHDPARGSIKRHSTSMIPGWLVFLLDPGECSGTMYPAAAPAAANAVLLCTVACCLCTAASNPMPRSTAVHLVEPSWNGINLDSQRWHCPAVNDISAGYQQANQAVCGQHQTLISVKQTQLTRLNICSRHNKADM